MKCPYCNKAPHEISEYVLYAEMEGITPEQFVKNEEGTYSSETQLFCCTTCYVTIGMPTNARLREAFELYREQIEPLSV